MFVGIFLIIATAQSFWIINEEFDQRGNLVPFEKDGKPLFSPQEIGWNMRGLIKKDVIKSIPWTKYCKNSIITHLPTMSIDIFVCLLEKQSPPYPPPSHLCPLSYLLHKYKYMTKNVASVKIV